MFKQFWDVFIFIINSLIFFYVGAAVVNFVVRAGQELYGDGVAELFKVWKYGGWGAAVGRYGVRS